MNERVFHSKTILFGEYSMIFDSTALMVPMTKFSAHLRFASPLSEPGASASNANIKRFADYLQEQEDLREVIDLPMLNHDLQNGLFLDSDVPSGYGLGSSGTLVAAIYDRYAKQKQDDLLLLKPFFGRMESCFHGSSSGIDPLQCYLGKPFRITPKAVELLPNNFIPNDIHVFLVDTGIKSNTKPLVQHFRKKCEDPEYLKAFQTSYVPCVSACIDKLVAGQKEAFFGALRQLTDGQLRFLRPMITDNTIDLFLEKPGFHFGVKISGSGGGGYVLGFTDDINKTKAFMEGYDIIWLENT